MGPHVSDSMMSYSSITEEWPEQPWPSSGRASRRRRGLRRLAIWNAGTETTLIARRSGETNVTTRRLGREISRAACEWPGHAREVTRSRRCKRLKALARVVHAYRATGERARQVGAWGKKNNASPVRPDRWGQGPLVSERTRGREPARLSWRTQHVLLGLSSAVRKRKGKENRYG